MNISKETVEERKRQLIQLTTDFSERYLNEEYEDTVEKLINKMSRKKDVPFATGKIDIWAAAVIHALGMVNFLFDKKNHPYISVTDICEFFGTKQSTTTQKSKKIRDMFNMTYFDKEFSTKSSNEANPLNNIVMINGLPVPMDKEEEQSSKMVVLEDWQLQAAQILGFSTLVARRKYNEEKLLELLIATEKNLMKFYHYLQQHLTFPFYSSFSEEVGPITFAEHAVKFHRLDQQMEVDEWYGIFIEGREGRKKVVVPLVEVEVSEDHANYQLIDLYSGWFWYYRNA